MFAVFKNYGKISYYTHNTYNIYYKNTHMFVYVYTYYKSVSFIISFSCTFGFNTQQLYIILISNEKCFVTESWPRYFHN